VACRALTQPAPAIPDVEAAAIREAVATRKLEFAAGRTAAREALGLIGVAPVPIPVGAGRAPQWPSGVVGSIAHQKDLAVAVVARTEHILGLGVDIEASGALTEELWPQILVPPEVKFLQSLATEKRSSCATVFFALKEAFYKFQFPHTKQWLDFGDVEIDLDPAQESATLRISRFLTIGTLAQNAFAARYRMGDELTLAAVSLAAS
jgi:4'-phosphopantetheinyl transferase EntD